MDPNTTKHPLASKGVMGAVVAIVAAATPQLLSLAGVDPSISASEIVDLVSRIVADVGAVIALYGRLTAKKRIL